jgi:ribosome-binding factor A
MGQRVIRVNELLKREISQVLHTRYRGEAVDITVLAVDSTPDLRHARVLYATHGDRAKRPAAAAFLRRQTPAIRAAVGGAVVLKYLPQLEFVYDEGADASARVNELLDDLGLAGDAAGGEAP